MLYEIMLLSLVQTVVQKCRNSGENSSTDHSLLRGVFPSTTKQVHQEHETKHLWLAVNLSFL